LLLVLRRKPLFVDFLRQVIELGRIYSTLESQEFVRTFAAPGELCFTKRAILPAAPEVM
jgi:hypothetical protein